jgi:hypothetical protein
VIHYKFNICLKNKYETMYIHNRGRQCNKFLELDAFMGFYMTAIAYLAVFLIYQGGKIPAF